MQIVAFYSAVVTARPQFLRDSLGVSSNLSGSSRTNTQSGGSGSSVSQPFGYASVGQQTFGGFNFGPGGRRIPGNPLAHLG